MIPAAVAVSVFGIGCSPVPGSGGDTCVDWVRFATPQDQFDNAILVVVGKPQAQNGDTRIYGYNARSHQVEIETVLTGDPGQESLRVASMPQTCGTSYPDGDPLDLAKTVPAVAHARFAAEQVTRALVGRTVADVERDLILETLKHCLGNRTHAANILGISIRTLRNKLKEYSEAGVSVPAPQMGSNAA